MMRRYFCVEKQKKWEKKKKRKKEKEIRGAQKPF
jgi:hypothetical protein